MTKKYVAEGDPQSEESVDEPQATQGRSFLYFSPKKVSPEVKNGNLQKLKDSKIQIENAKNGTAAASGPPKQKLGSNFLTPNYRLQSLRKTSIQIINDNIDALYKGRVSTSMYKMVKSWIAPAETTANVKLLGGKRAMHEEKMRAHSSGWIIHPFSQFRYYWDIIIMLALLINLVILPLNIAFFSIEHSKDWVVFHSISDLFFILDIALNFRTGYKKTQNGYRAVFVLDPKLIAKRYLRTWFALDLISSLPIDNVILLVSGEIKDLSLGVKSASRALKFLRITKILSLLKLLRLSKVLRYVSKFQEFYHITASVMRYVKLIMMMLFVAHWNGCLGFLVAMLLDFPEQSWVSLNNLQESHWTEQYGWALFKALSHMLCIGYGRFIPQLLSEASVTIFSMVTGATFYALFIAHSMAYIQQNDSARRLYQEKFQQIEEYMSYRNLPNATRERIQDYYEHKYTQKRLFNELEILAEVSKPIRDDIINHNCRDLIESVPFLRGGDPDFLTLIVSKLQFDVYLPNDIIIKEGAIGDEMYFIRHGSVDVIVTEEYITTLTEGEYFGEITMLTDARRVATVKAATVCDLFILTNENLYMALEEFPDMRKIMEHVALDRLMKLKTKFPDCLNTTDAARDLESRAEPSDSSHTLPISPGNSISSDASSTRHRKTSSKIGRPLIQREEFSLMTTIIDAADSCEEGSACECERCGEDEGKILT